MLHTLLNTRIRIALTGAAGFTLAAACTTTGNVERNAAGGAALGGLAGAVIGNNVGDGDAGRGAAIGAALGAGAGAVRGYSQDQRIEECRQAPGYPLYRDPKTGGNYYYAPNSNRTCWESGAPRG